MHHSASLRQCDTAPESKSGSSYLVASMVLALPLTTKRVCLSTAACDSSRNSFQEAAIGFPLVPKNVHVAAGIQVPLGRWGSAAEVAGVVEFLCGPQSTYITGQVINVDGGIVNS